MPKLCQQNIAAGILQIDFVDEDECRDVITCKQAPQGFGVSLHAVVGTHNQNRIVKRAQRALRLGRKIDVAGRIHEHDVGITVVEHGLRRKKRDATLALDRVRVQMRIAIVHAAALANATRVEQHDLGQRGLAGIDVRQDSNDRLLRHGSPLIASPSHAATGVHAPHWMIQFTGRRAKRALSPDQAHRPALPRGDFRRFAPCESRLANQRSERKWPHPGPFSFVRIVDTCPYSYASRSQSNATRGVPSDTYTTPARSNPALILAPCMGRLSRCVSMRR